ncbi:monomeric [FeFe] hydrogenase [Coprobacter tertius]|uniref:Monomeric [FeFe] hydrogenase n=1 Tax=Coprobacter tertius TaxID=2944915 RepID=A0ABT1MJD9_9BACT|nr:monomeric [FeFe] hydrogenase [Coprobacter tertius]MCP9612727.1 monomeric [FeFe] hydrogenase [Coprobacter tertius]
MAFANNVLIVRRVLMAKLVDLWNRGQLVEQIDRLPIELTPRNAKVRGRCCVHKERAVWKYKSFPLMGFDMQDETDELVPLSHYAREALTRGKNKKDNILCVIDEACSACVQVNYEVTNLCKGCVARACYMNCSRHAISFDRNGQARIDHDKCISCGICKEACPYHAIVYIPIPCEEACPVKAISKDENGIEHIDESKCIYCGKCINACPFGSIFEISEVFDVLSQIRSGSKVVAIVAPSIMGQYKESLEEIFNAIGKIGFYDVMEVADGAMVTTRNEAVELKEKLAEGQSFMTTSCCPSYIELVEKHVKDMKPYVSHTGSPMYYTARMAKEKYPDALVVFVGPCVAKRAEARRDEAVDYVMTFEEIDAVFHGLGIDVATVGNGAYFCNAEKDGKGFGRTGGVLGAVKAQNLIPDLKGAQIANLNKKNIALLRAYAKGKSPFQFIEVMACEGGCVTGPSSNVDSVTGDKLFKLAMEKYTAVDETTKIEK